MGVFVGVPRPLLFLRPHEDNEEEEVEDNPFATLEAPGVVAAFPPTLFPPPPPPLLSPGVWALDSSKVTPLSRSNTPSL